MLIWVIYDISDDQRRTRIAKSCKEYGLQRIQKSVFLGNLPGHCVDEIAAFSRELIDQKTDAVFILPCCETDFGKRIVVGKKDFDEALVQGTKKTLLILTYWN
jgi:CRISPR-associated protein Cas2